VPEIPSGYLPAAVFSSLVFDLVRDASFDDAMRAARDLLVREERHEETTAALDVALTMRAPSFTEIEALPNGGWTGEWALAIAVACVRDARDAADAMWRAAAHAGDSDSTASIAGSLLGAMGVELPSAWLADLELRAVVESLAAKLVGQAAA